MRERGLLACKARFLALSFLCFRFILAKNRFLFWPECIVVGSSFTGEYLSGTCKLHKLNTGGEVHFT